MKTNVFCLLMGLFSIGMSAPVLEPALPVLEDARPHRESTKEILNLESQLKQQAGEDKKFLSQPEIVGIQPPPPPDVRESSIEQELPESDEESDIIALQKSLLMPDIANIPDYAYEKLIKHNDLQDSDDDTEEGDEEEEEEEEVDDDYMFNNIMQKFREHPEWMELLANEPKHGNEVSSDEQDRADALRAEYMAAMGWPPSNKADETPQDRHIEDIHEFPGDSTAHEVAKKFGYETPEEYDYLVHPYAHGNLGGNSDESEDVDTPYQSLDSDELDDKSKEESEEELIKLHKYIAMGRLPDAKKLHQPDDEMEKLKRMIM